MTDRDQTPQTIAKCRNHVLGSAGYYVGTCRRPNGHTGNHRRKLTASDRISLRITAQRGTTNADTPCLHCEHSFAEHSSEHEGFWKCALADCACVMFRNCNGFEVPVLSCHSSPAMDALPASPSETTTRILMSVAAPDMHSALTVLVAVFQDSLLTRTQQDAIECAKTALNKAKG
jgi:hypothetical protein